MPRRNRAKRAPLNKRRNRRARRRYRKYPRSAQRSTSNFPLARRMRATHRYVEYGSTLNSGAAGTAATYVYSCNGLYDPNITGVGHQPIGFDQFSAMYENATVIGSKITATFRSVDSTYPSVCGISVRSSSTPDTDIKESIENGNTVYGTVTSTSDSGGRSLLTLTKGFSLRKFKGSKSIADDLLTTTSSSNPTNQWYYHLWAAPDTLVDSTGVIIDLVTITYIAIWTEPKILSSS